MSYDRLIYHNKSSTYFGARVVCPLVQAVIKGNVTLAPAVGVNSFYINDNLNYTNITRQLAFFMERPTFHRNWFTWGMNFGDWLVNEDKFVEYEPLYSEPSRGWHWETYSSESPAVTSQKGNITNVTMSLACKPFLANDEATKYQSVPTIPTHNPAKYSSLSLFYIVGNGDFTLTVNGAQYQFRDTDDELFIDSEKWIVYKSLTERRTSRAILPSHEHSVLIPGKNTISSQGNYPEPEYQLKWRRAIA